MLTCINKKRWKHTEATYAKAIEAQAVKNRAPKPVELFIDTIITNNEERTVEQAAHRVRPELKLKQYRYIGMRDREACEAALSSLSTFNGNKEIAYVRERGQFFRWNGEKKTMEKRDGGLFKGLALLRINEPDTGAGAFGEGSDTGICYDCRGVGEDALKSKELLEVFGNPHASSLFRMQ